MDFERNFNLLRKKVLSRERAQNLGRTSFAESLVGLPWEHEWNPSTAVIKVAPKKEMRPNSPLRAKRTSFPKEKNSSLPTVPRRVLPSVRPQKSLLLNNLSQCKKCFPEGENCPLQEYNNPVSPNHRAMLNIDNGPIDILFLVDFPIDRNENSLNQIFMGDRALFFERTVQALGLDDGKYCWSTLIKCNPKEKENFDEMASNCFSWLNEEILYLRPKYVLTFGALPTRFLSGKRERLAKIHGKFFEKSLKGANGEIHQFQYFPLFHVDYILMNPSMKKTTWTDLQKIIERLSQD